MQQQAILSDHMPCFPPWALRITNWGLEAGADTLHQSGQLTRATHGPFLPCLLGPFLPVGLGYISSSRKGHPGPFPCFSRDRACGPAEKSNYNLLSWWNPITTSLTVEWKPIFLIEKEAEQRVSSRCPYTLPSFLGNYTERLQEPWLALLRNNGHNLLQ